MKIMKEMVSAGGLSCLGVVSLPAPGLTVCVPRPGLY